MKESQVCCGRLSKYKAQKQPPPIAPGGMPVSSCLALQHSFPVGFALGWLCDLSWHPSSSWGITISLSSRLLCNTSSPPTSLLLLCLSQIFPSLLPQGDTKLKPTRQSKYKYFLSLPAAPSLKYTYGLVNCEPTTIPVVWDKLTMSCYKSMTDFFPPPQDCIHFTQ